MIDHFHGKSAARQPAGSMQGWGKKYDFIVDLMSLGQEKKFRQATLELAKIQPGESILEVGCGTGSLTLVAKIKAGPKGQVCGIDIASDMIDTARRKAAKAGLGIQFQVGRIESISYPDSQFDVVLSSLMLHHVPDPKDKQKGLSEALRVLRPGGRLLIVDVEPPQNPFIKGLAGLIIGREMFAHNVREFIPLLEEAGFVDIETGPTNFRFLAYLIGKRAT